MLVSVAFISVHREPSMSKNIQSMATPLAWHSERLTEAARAAGFAMAGIVPDIPQAQRPDLKAWHLSWPWVAIRRLRFQ